MENKTTNIADNAEVIVTGEGLNENLDSVTTLAPLTSTSLAKFAPEQQTQITNLASQVDVQDLEKVMSYGQIPLLRSFEHAQKILQDDRGSAAEQQVVKMVVELSKQANKDYDDFNIMLKEPGFLQKILLRLSTAAKEQHSQELSLKAVTLYNLLSQLSESCDSWLEMLQDGYTKIHQSAESDRDNCIEVEEYIVAGRIAEERIQGEVDAAKAAWESSGLIADREKYETLQEGLDTFHIVLLNLEKSRAAYGISIGQLGLQRKANKNIQIAVHTQKANSIALAGQQLRNAVLDAKNKIALEGQKSIAALNNELMKKVAESTVLTAEESEKILLTGVYSIEAGLEAAKTVITGCEVIKKAAADRNSQIDQQLSKLKGLLTELEPFVSKLQDVTETNGSSTPKVSASSSPKGELKF